jgi:ribosome maturation factor RimP
MLAKEYFPIVEPCCEQHGAHLIDIVLRGKQARPVVEVLIDAESGVTSELCSAVSREVGKRLDEWDRIPESYTLIVSSPGIEKPLKFLWQFKKHVGRKFVLKVNDIAGAEEVTGTLLSVGDDAITIEVGKGNETATIRFDAIAEAVVKSPW